MERHVFSVIIVGMAASQPVRLVLLDRDGTPINHDGVVAAGELSPCRVSRWTVIRLSGWDARAIPPCVFAWVGGGRRSRWLQRERD
jgi:hypothetical protein